VAGQKPREIAARVLWRYRARRRWLDNLLQEALAEAGLSRVDRGLVEELCLGVARWETALDWLIARLTEGRRQRPWVQVLLRLGLYQLFWLDRVPEHAAVHETVAVAKQVSSEAEAGFINALLRRCLRERATLQQALAQLKQQQPALAYSHPQWLCHRWQQRWGEAALRQLLDWNNRPAPNYARLNTLRADAQRLTAAWAAEGVRARPCSFRWLPDGLVFELQDHPPLTTLPSFQNGLFYVQDPSTLLAPIELGPQPGERVLDLCAAPGGKTTFLAQLMQNQGHIVARDTHAARLKLLRDNCHRLGVACVEPVWVSAKPTPAQASRIFDRVLVDAPCSNTGVLRRRVDLRWRLQPHELTRLQQLQLELLHQAASELKPGGRLVYSTCSLEPEENQQVIAAFLHQHPTWQLEKETELLPFTDAVDGAYVARLRAPA
jgi:16S rRNA (cytosine967-C5)-methyltransferase